MNEKSKREPYGDRLGGTIDLCSAILAFIAVGLFLNLHEGFVFSREATVGISTVCFGVAAVILIVLGYRLKKKHGLLGIPEIGLSSFMLYLISNLLFAIDSSLARTVGLVCFAFDLFILIGGCIAFSYSILQKIKSDMSKVESVVVIITSLITVAIAVLESWL